MAIRLALVNDYEVVVRGLASMLRSYSDRVEVVEIATSSPVGSPVDIALYDTFAESRGDRAVERLVANPGVDKVVVYTWELDPEVEGSRLRTGVAGYLSKRLPASDLVAALEQVHSGERVVSDDPVRSGPVGGDWPAREEGLTARESEVLALITRGLTNAEIVRHTGLSINSIKSYIRSAYRKIGVATRSRAVLWGIAHGFQPDAMRAVDVDFGDDD